MKIFHEEKQVGIIYHFTSLAGMLGIHFLLGLKSNNNDYISFSRNFDLTRYEGDFKDAHFRLVFDGTAMSNRYKIEPFFDTDPTVGLTRRNGEYEERIIWPKGKVLRCLDYLLQIDIQTRVFPKDLPETLTRDLKVPVNASMLDFKPYKK